MIDRNLSIWAVLVRVTRASTVALALLTTAAVAAPAHADMLPPRPFSADSGDACGFGYAKGSVLWVTPGPLPPTSVKVTGVVVDRPGPTTARRRSS